MIVVVITVAVPSSPLPSPPTYRFCSSPLLASLLRNLLTNAIAREATAGRQATPTPPPHPSLPSLTPPSRSHLDDSPLAFCPFLPGFRRSGFKIAALAGACACTGPYAGDTAALAPSSRPRPAAPGLAPPCRRTRPLSPPPPTPSLGWWCCDQQARAHAAHEPVMVVYPVTNCCWMVLLLLAAGCRLNGNPVGVVVVGRRQRPHPTQTDLHPTPLACDIVIMMVMTEAPPRYCLTLNPLQSRSPLRLLLAGGGGRCLLPVATRSDCCPRPDIAALAAGFSLLLISTR